MRRANINFENPQTLIIFFTILTLLTTMCVTITGVTQPETAQVSERISITIDAEVKPAAPDEVPATPPIASAFLP